MTDRPNSELQPHTGSCQGEKGHDDGSRRVEMPDEMSFYGYTESELLARYPCDGLSVRRDLGGCRCPLKTQPHHPGRCSGDLSPETVFLFPQSASRTATPRRLRSSFPQTAAGTRGHPGCWCGATGDLMGGEQRSSKKLLPAMDGSRHVAR
jgi:hypothetical protein